MQTKELYIQAIKKWGAESQILMAIEEMSELIKALCKYPRTINNSTRNDILEEIVDVQIMIEQLLITFDVDLLEFEEAKMSKLYRLKDLLKLP